MDSHGKERNALVTAVWAPTEEQIEFIRQRYDKETYFETLKQRETPSINVVIISNDENKHDSYGRQIERHISVVHISNQYAHGNYWKELK